MGHTYLSLVVLSILFGAVISSVPTVSTPLIVDLIGINNLNTAFGILTFARGFAAIIGPSAAGFILDNVSSHYSIPFYIASFLFGASTANNQPDLATLHYDNLYYDFIISILYNKLG